MIDKAAKPKAKAVNVGAQRVAAVYAKALLGAAESKGQTDAVLGELHWRLKNHQAAAWNFRRALSLAQVGPEQLYLTRMLARSADDPALAFARRHLALEYRIDRAEPDTPADVQLFEIGQQRECIDLAVGDHRRPADSGVAALDSTEAESLQFLSIF